MERWGGKMLTKNECAKALNGLYFSDGSGGRDDEFYNVLMELINEHFELKREYEAVKAAEKLCKEVERFCTNETYFAVIVKAISKCEDKELVDNAIHCLAYLKKQLENPHLKFEEMEEEE